MRAPSWISAPPFRHGLRPWAARWSRNIRVGGMSPPSGRVCRCHELCPWGSTKTPRLFAWAFLCQRELLIVVVALAVVDVSIALTLLLAVRAIVAYLAGIILTTLVAMTAGVGVITAAGTVRAATTLALAFALRLRFSFRLSL